MSLRLLKIVVYSHTGQLREVQFNEHGLSVVTGASKTGKSSLIDIIDYCTGRDTCNVADGVIRRSVSWYGVLFERGDTRIFVARRNPPMGESRDPNVYLEVGANSNVPPFQRLQKNITVEGLEAYLTSAVGISENLHTPPVGQTHAPLSANFRHGLLFSFQDQDEIDSRKVLFHRQGEQFMPQTIKDVLPYFLGAVDEERLRKQAELDQTRKELRRLERLAGEQEESQALATSRAVDIYREAQSVGLLEAGAAPSLPELLMRLRAITATLTLSEAQPDVEGPLAELRTERNRLRSDLSLVREELRQARHIEYLAGGYEEEAQEQRSRLGSLRLVPSGKDEIDECALCGNKIEEPIAKASEINESLRELEQQLRTVRREVPRLQSLQADLLGRQASVEGQLRENQRRTDEQVALIEGLAAERDNRIKQARTAGRITYFLETVRPDTGPSDLQSRITLLRAKVDALQAVLDPEDVQERLTSFLNIIGTYMTEYSSALELEHSGSRLRLDLRHLAVVADTEDGPVPLNRMGSGENWVGYHVLAHLALHKWFRHKGRPVPAFLVFDQPSQAHYPPEVDAEGDVGVLGDEDRAAVYQLFKLMADVAKELSPGFQLIVIDHADLKEDWFSGAVVQRWRGENKLIPADWPRS